MSGFNIPVSVRLVHVVKTLRSRMFAPRNNGQWERELRRDAWRVSTSDTWVFGGRIAGRQVVKITSHQEIKHAKRMAPGSGGRAPFAPRPTMFAFEGNQGADQSCTDACVDARHTKPRGLQYPISPLKWFFSCAGRMVTGNPAKFIKTQYGGGGAVSSKLDEM